MEKDFIICSCHNVEHSIIFHYDKEYKGVYISIHLKNLSFIERLKNGIKYIFGFKSKYGDFDEFMVNENDLDKFKKIVETLENKKAHQENS